MKGVTFGRFRVRFGISEPGRLTLLSLAVQKTGFCARAIRRRQRQDRRLDIGVLRAQKWIGAELDVISSTFECRFNSLNGPKEISAALPTQASPDDGCIERRKWVLVA
jgi:hypothetical protein